MNAVSDFLALNLQRLLKLLLLAGLGVFLLSLVLLGLGAALVSVLWALLRGKRPALFTVYQAFRQAARFGRGQWAARSARPTTGRSGDGVDVVDVEVVERVDGHPLLPRAERSPVRE